MLVGRSLSCRQMVRVNCEFYIARGALCVVVDVKIHELIRISILRRCFWYYFCLRKEVENLYRAMLCCGIFILFRTLNELIELLLYRYR